MSIEQATVYADIVKVETRPSEPNYRYVHSRISDETKDLDGQTADYDWLKTALPDWFKWGNVRDMHENNVVAKGKELTDLGSTIRGFDGVLKVVDPVAVIKVDEGLFSGVSIGIKGPRVINEKGTTISPHAPGRIVGGKIVEVSLVDHPCNESCKLTVLKAAKKGGLQPTKSPTLEILKGSGATADLLKVAGAYWFKRAKWDATARANAEAAGHAEAGGRFPIEDASDVSDAVHLINTGHGNETDRSHVITQAKRLGMKNPFKSKGEKVLGDRMVTPNDLTIYKKRFDPAFAKQSLSLTDGSYVIVDEGDLLLAKALLLTGFGNATAADLLIKRREKELLGKATPAPGARENRDDNAEERPASDNPDKATPAHQSPAASGSEAAFNESAAGEHPPTRAKKKKGKNNTTIEVDPHTHGDDTGAQGTQTNSAKGSKVKQKLKQTTTWKAGKFATGDPAEWSDKKLLKGFQSLQKAATNTGPQSFTDDSNDFVRGGAGSPGGGRVLMEQMVRQMQGRMADVAQGSQAPDAGRNGEGGPDSAEDEGNDDLLNSGSLMRDGDSRVGHATPEAALAQGGPMKRGDAVVSSAGAGQASVSALPFDSAPQPGSSSSRTSPGNLPGTVRASGDAAPRIQSGGPSGSGGPGVAAAPARSVSPAPQRGPATEGGRSSGGAPNTAFAFGKKKGAKADKKKRKWAKEIDKIAKAAVSDRMEAVAPDAVKAAVAGLLKKFVKDLEKSVLTKYATADEVKSLQNEVERLGQMASPGGPFVGKIVSQEKEFAANEMVESDSVITSAVLDRMQRLLEMSKATHRGLASSAQAELTKMLTTYFPGQDVEIEAVLARAKPGKRSTR